MKREQRDILRDDEGAVAIIVAACLMVFIVFSALAIDLGYFYNVRRGLQSAADAGALAGCQELLMSRDAGVADAKAREFALANAAKPADGLSVEDVNVGGDYVQVTVAKTVGYFFGGAAGGGGGGRTIHAQARAKVSALSGLKGLVPWFMPVMVAKEVRVQLSGGGAYQTLMSSGGNQFSGGWNPGLGVSVSTQTGNGKNKGKIVQRTVTGRRMDLIAINDYGVQAPFTGATGVCVAPSDSPITDVHVSPQMLPAGGGGVDVDVYVSSAAKGTLTASLGGSSIGSHAVSGGTTHYYFHGSVGSSGSFGLNLSVGEVYGSQDITSTFTINDAAIVSVRQRNDVFQDLTASPTFFRGGCGSTLYTVDMMGLDSFLPGDTQDLKLGAGDSVCGNFQPLALGGNGGSNYRDNIANGYDGTVYIGQTLNPEPGNMVGPTRQGESDRFGGDSCTYDSWVAAGEPGCPRVVYVPLCEWTGDPTGRSQPVVVRAFAAFFVEGSPSSTVVGRFIKYIAAGIPGPGGPPFDKELKTVRLTSEGVQY